MKNTTKEELLHLLNDSLYPILVELLNDMGMDEIQFTPKNCLKQCVQHNGDTYSFRGGGWIRHTNKENRRVLYDDDTSEVLIRILSAYGEVINDLKKRKRKIKKELKDLKKTGCFNQSFERILITERTE